MLLPVTYKAIELAPIDLNSRCITNALSYILGNSFLE